MDFGRFLTGFLVLTGIGEWLVCLAVFLAPAIWPVFPLALTRSPSREEFYLKS